MHSKPDEDTSDLSYDTFSVHKILCPSATALFCVLTDHSIYQQHTNHGSTGLPRTQPITTALFAEDGS